MDNKKHIKKELEELGSSLSKLQINRKDISLDEYFGNMNQSVMDTITAQDSDVSISNDYFDKMQESVMSKVKPKTRLKYLPLISRIAAVFVMVLGSIWLFDINPTSSKNIEDTFVDNLQDEEMIYLLEEFGTMEEIAQLTEENLGSIILPDETEDMLQYLDESDIIEQLEL